MDQNESTAVVVITAEHLIRGRIALIPGARLTDYVQHAGPFMAITEVEVRSAADRDRLLFRADFLDVATAHIVMILPASSWQDPG